MSADPEPIARCPEQILAATTVLLTDVDDTLTRDGRLHGTTLTAMESLAAAGIRVIAITGACAGWGHHIVRTWPVAAVVAESGAVAMRRQGSRLEQACWQTREQLREEQARVLAIAHRLAERHGLPLAADQPYRLADVAIDHGQEVGPTPRSTVQALLAALHAEGLRATASSIHVNAWVSDFDKARMAERCLRDWFGLTGDPLREQVGFVGDASNDEPMFAWLSRTFGVANIKPHLPAMAARPRWITDRSHGAGFEELAERLLTARQQASTA